MLLSNPSGSVRALPKQAVPNAVRPSPLQRVSGRNRQRFQLHQYSQPSTKLYPQSLLDGNLLLTHLLHLTSSNVHMTCSTSHLPTTFREMSMSMMHPFDNARKPTRTTVWMIPFPLLWS